MKLAYMCPFADISENDDEIIVVIVAVSPVFNPSSRGPTQMTDLTVKARIGRANALSILATARCSGASETRHRTWGRHISVSFVSIRSRMSGAIILT
ncbi:hypothetical protein [Defluviimonas salinarum]|nr:hypothetical protein [Defluviimonas salinarum]